MWKGLYIFILRMGVIWLGGVSGGAFLKCLKTRTKSSVAMILTTIRGSAKALKKSKVRTMQPLFWFCGTWWWLKRGGCEVFRKPRFKICDLE